MASPSATPPPRPPSSQKVLTYHCTFCSHLLLATTYTLSTLPTRQPPSLDRALIAPLPPPPRNPDSDSDDEHSSDSDPDDESDSDPGDDPAAPQAQAQPKPKKKPKLKPYTLLLSSTRDRNPKIITREDGFEKRYLWRCGRCKLIYGYQLDEMHYPDPNTTQPTTTAQTTSSAATKGKSKGVDAAQSEEQGEGSNTRWKKKKKKRKDYVYFLPGALIPTEELGREVKEHETGFEGVGAG